MNRGPSAKQSQSLSAAAALLLFALFALLAVGVLTAGMMVYQKTRANTDDTYQRRTALSYITNQVRQADRVDGIMAGEFHGQQAIVLRRQYNDIQYLTYIYTWDGSLRELFFEEGLDLPPEGGVVIMPLEQLSVSQSEEGLLRLELDHGDGVESALTLSIRSGEGSS